MATSDNLQSEIAPLNRREFLYYILGGSIVLAAGGIAVGLLRYMIPDPKKIDPTRFMTLSANEFAEQMEFAKANCER